MRFSVIIPVYNRPDEIDELLESLTKQTYKNFEVIIVEDGSSLDSKKVVEKYKDKLKIKYFYKDNEGPAIARNFGAKYAEGEYLVFIDSDVIVPPKYFEIVNKELQKEPVDVYGGPDAAAEDFTPLQKAISYSMTAFLTSGKIRSDEKIDKYYPRSFNMGVKKSVFFEIGGFPITRMHPGEDMVFSIELIKRGYKTKLIKDAFVYHKRRNTLKSFFKQVYRFGKTRHIISRVYPETFKIYYLAPTVFTFGNIILLLSAIYYPIALLPIGLYVTAIFIDSLLKNRSLKVALLSILTTYIQHFGYGIGFIIPLLTGDEYNVFKSGFY